LVIRSNRFGSNCCDLAKAFEITLEQKDLEVVEALGNLCHIIGICPGSNNFSIAI
jgi:hypothetical protein